MKHFEKNFPGFSVIYLHNYLKCKNCILLTASYNESCKSQDESHESEDSDTESFFKPFKSLSAEEIDMYPDEELLQYSFLYTPRHFNNTPLNPVKKIRKKQKFQSNAGKSVKPLCDNSPTSRKRKKTTPKIQKKKSPPKRSEKETGKKSMDSGAKVPGKGTLKRKRWVLEKLERLNDDHEADDLFEDRDFGRFRDLLGDESDYTDRYDQLQTPVFPFSITPRETTPSPNGKSFSSPSKVSVSRRKEAQQYHYRRMKRMKKNSVPEKEEATPKPEQPEDEKLRQCMQQVAHLLSIYKAKKGQTSDSDDDPYYSDVLNN